MNGALRDPSGQEEHINKNYDLVFRVLTLKMQAFWQVKHPFMWIDELNLVSGEVSV